MSLKLSKNFIHIRDIFKIKQECYVEGYETDYGPAEKINVYGETNNSLYIPFSYARKYLKSLPNKDLIFSNTTFTFNRNKYPFKTNDQKEVFKEALKIIETYGSVLLSLYCGYGKTYLGIRLAHKSKLKCAILVHRKILVNQWKNSINKFTSANVQIVDTDGILDPNADFYIFNIAFVHKKWNADNKIWCLKKLGIYKNTIGVLIVDEAHIACASEMSRSLLYFNPKNVIALTATPFRRDGLDKVLELYFGDYDTTRIIRISNKPFTVYRLSTDIKPEYKYNSMGKKDWHTVINYLINSEKRNNMIIDLVKKFKDKFILILTKRKYHCKLLSDKLTFLGIKNTVMVGICKTYDKKCNVLLSTYSKLGVGFDDTRLNMLIVACSVTEIEQYAGRLRDGKERIIIDLVDNDYNCISHWRERRKWYLSRNGIIKNYNTKREEPQERKRLVRKQI